MDSRLPLTPFKSATADESSIEGSGPQEFMRSDGTMDIEFLKQQAERCRRLAKGTDPFTEKRLLKLAEEYEAQIKELEKRSLEPWSH
ncbi:hypothetical protein Nham_0421 [Nitrobacter hamburgensis X14]|uniref:Uncharacterized protein n=2 Tax=Nitrobacter hamburgensis TaxID=912 RepID=Q1QR35_NITHX|nr:hypothetical protein Nham_0421 [Nitrobacter hamburgensis X14]